MAGGLMDVHPTAIQGVKLLVPRRHHDDRGSFAEIFRADRFEELVGDHRFVQDNLSRSTRAGTIRGLHFQLPPFAQGKLVSCVEGAILDVAVDIREGSPSRGRHVAVELTAENGRWLWIPPGFAHGFCTLTANAAVLYKVTAHYSPEHDRGLAFDDPDLAIDWPFEAGAITASEKDRRQPRLADLASPFTHGPSERLQCASS